MNQYKIKHQNNKWKQLLDESIYKNIEEITNEFVDQLNEDKNNLNKGENVSDCAINSPYIGSSIDKKILISHKIANKLFPCSDNENKDPKVIKKYIYIQYSQLISNLRKKFKEQLKKEESNVNEFKEIRRNNQRHLFCSLKKKPLSDSIINPTPMPVDIAPIEELNPFFEYLNKNIPVLDQDYIKFQRGAYYSDGRIDLCKQVVGNTWINDLVNSIKKNPYVNHFLLGNNITGYEGAKAIANFINEKHASKIKTWYLAGNEINFEGIKLISNALENDQNCESLWLKRNPIKSEGAKYIGQMLTKNKFIKILDLDNTGLLDDGIKFIFENLKQNSTLRHLYIDANGITEVGAKYISNYFNFLCENKLKGISSLWIGINRLDDNGIILISEALKNYTYLRRLVVESNRITAKGAKILFELLKNHKNLICLDLGLYKSTSDLQELPNNLGDESCEYISEFIKTNKSCKVLSILHNNISINGLKIINQALEQNDSLLYIYFEQYGLQIPIEIKTSIVEKLKKNIFNSLNIDLNEFLLKHLRFIKHSKKIKNIDSIYRNKM